jgi:hypothetical protein
MVTSVWKTGAAVADRLAISEPLESSIIAVIT